MRKIGFTGRDLEARVARLREPISHASVETAPYRGAFAVTLWYPDGKGTRITPIMHDIAERFEVGVLNFVSVTRPADDEAIVELPSSFRGPIKVSKLVVNEEGISADSGLLLEAGDGQQIVIVAAAFPFSLFTAGVLPTSDRSDPEYPLSDYQRIDLTSDAGLR